MSIGDCIQINENQFYTNSNIVVHYSNINCNNDLRSGNNLFYEDCCQNFQNKNQDVNINQSEYSFSLISQSSKMLDEDYLDISLKKDNVIKNHLNGSNITEKLNLTNVSI